MRAPAQSREQPSEDGFTPQDGFTLVEVLVALFVFSIISVATLSGLTSTLRAKDGVAAGLDRIERLAVLDRIIRDDMANVVTRPTRDAFGTPELNSFELYGALDLMTFTRTGRANPEGLAPRGDLMRVRYNLEDGALVRRTPALPTPAVNTPEVERVLVDGVARLQILEDLGELAISPRGTAGNNAAPPGGEVPYKALRFELEFEDGQTLTHIVEVGS